MLIDTIIAINACSCLHVDLLRLSPCLVSRRHVKDKYGVSQCIISTRLLNSKDVRHVVSFNDGKQNCAINPDLGLILLVLKISLVH